MKLVGAIVGLCMRAVLLAFELVLWAGALAFGAVVFLIDFVKARASLRGGLLHCPRGHRIPTDGDATLIAECAVCGFVYSCDKNSLLICPNVECRARTSFLHCPTCGLSRRIPYRFGR